jgi:hypothetical protein
MTSPLHIGDKLGSDARNSNNLANGNTNLFNISRQKIHDSAEEDYYNGQAP